MVNIVACLRVQEEIECIPWVLANLTFADSIVIADGGSKDETIEYIRRQTDPRIKLYHWEMHHYWYQNQAEHFEFLFNLAQLENPDWWLIVEADEWPTIEFQDNIRQVLEAIKREDHVSVGYKCDYLATGWSDYYPKVSEYNNWLCHNKRPRVLSVETETGLEFVPPKEIIPLGEDKRTVHVN